MDEAEEGNRVDTRSRRVVVHVGDYSPCFWLVDCGVIVE